MRKRTNLNKKNDLLTYGIGIVSVAILITIGLLVYNLFKADEVEEQTIKSSDFTAQKQDEGDSSQEVSLPMENTLEENTVAENNTTNEVAEKTAINTSIVKEKEEVKTKENTTKNKTEKKEEKKKELSFSKPVEGEIIKEFAKDTLLYSATLNEWTTHQGIDIKADKTTVVKAAEAGTVKYIKNDPRYGLSVVIEHDDGYTTVYANLLTSEFVVEGEDVKKGQTIGTVGNTAAFEIADESHLHFEILKDGEQQDPNTYIK